MVMTENSQIPVTVLSFFQKFFIIVCTDPLCKYTARFSIASLKIRIISHVVILHFIFGQKKGRKSFPGSSPDFVLFCFLYFLIISFSDTKFFTLLYLIWLRSHQRIQHQRIIKFILKRDNGTAIKDQSLTFSTVGNIRKLMW